MPATCVGNRYQLEQPLGRGGLSTVWRGHDLRLDRPVAVKLLTPAALGEPSALERFDREARTVARLSHPNIVAVHDVGTEGETPYLVLELIEGPSLATVLRDGPLPIHQVLDVALQTCEALAATHAAGVVHRDIKPGNLLLARHGTVKVCDFGIAHLQHATTGAALTREGKAVGTSQYMAPEQITGDPVDARTDLYALGCVLYAMLVGSPPFAGGHPVDVAHQHLYDSPAPLRQRRPDISPDLAALVHQLLAKDPADRPASVEQVGHRLAVLTGEHASTAPPTAHLPLAPTSPVPAAAGADMTDGHPPTVALTQVRAGHRRHALPGTPLDRRLRALLVAGGAICAVLLAVLLSSTLFGSGGKEQATGSPTVASTAAPTEGADATEPAATTQPPPKPSPTAARQPRRAPRPADLIAGMQAGLPHLVRDGHLHKNSAKELNRRLDEASRALAEGDTDKAWNELRETADRVGELREQGDLTPTGYQALTAALTQLDQAFRSS